VEKYQKYLGQIVTSESASLPGHNPIAIRVSRSVISKIADQYQGYVDEQSELHMNTINFCDNECMKDTYIDYSISSLTRTCSWQALVFSPMLRQDSTFC